MKGESVAQARAAWTAQQPAPRRSRRKYVVLFGLLAVLAIGAVVVAASSDPSKVAGTVDVHHLPVGPDAPALEAANGWINSSPLTRADLRGKVVLYDFWTYSCVNCVRAIPHVEALYQRYARDGLVVVGVHSPEFDFEKNHSNVQAAVKRLDVTYPVALDDDLAIWTEFQNQYWPAHYLADRQGRLRAAGVGEGNYTETEDEVRALLDVPRSAPRAAAVHEGKVGTPPTARQDVTPETYLGLQRGIANAQPGIVTYPAARDTELGQPVLVGPWFGDTQDVASTASGAAIVMKYHAREANLVLASGAAGGAPVDLRITLDGKPLPPAYRTVDTKVAADGSTYVHIDSSDLYRLVLGPAIETHVLRLTAESDGVEAFAFTFSS
jgi:thiol-disulfide isomerase/thioredoxin